MRNAFVMLVLAALSVAAIPAHAQDTDPVAVLKSDAGFLEKLDSCRVLQLKGGPEAVPALAALLTDEKLSHPARLALESMPCAEALQALRDGLAKANGALKVGIIGSLAVRKDMESVPALTALLSDTDPSVAMAAAAALGRMGAVDATDALEKAHGQGGVPAATQRAFWDGLLDCAAALAAKGEKDKALATYETVLRDHSEGCSSQANAAALRGVALMKGGEEGAALLVKEGLESDDQMAFDLALRALPELNSPDTVSKALADVLPKLADDRKVAVIRVLGECGGGSAGPALYEAAKNGSVEVQTAAMGAMTRIAYVPALDLAKEWISSQSADLSQAAERTLSYFPGGEGDKILSAMLRSEDPAVRRRAVEMVGQGGLDEPAALLMEVAQSDADSGIRVAALQAMRSHAGMNQMSLLLNYLNFAETSDERNAAESVLAAICGRQQKASTSDIVVQEAVYGALPDGPQANATEKIAQMVAGGATSIPAGNHLCGDTAPGVVKQLRVNYTVKGVPASQTVKEGETLVLNTASVPPAMVDAFCSVLEQAQGEVRLSLIRLLGTTGSAKALDVVKNAAFQDQDAAAKDAALRELCNWSTVDALPILMDLAVSSANPDIKVLARRGAVRLLGMGRIPVDDRLKHFSTLMNTAENADDKKLVLSGLAQVRDVKALDVILLYLGDEAVRAEAVQAAVAIDKSLGKNAKEDNSLYDGRGIDEWQGDKSLWRFDNGTIIGGGEKAIDKNEFLWAPGDVGDFYLAIDVKLEPDTANAGIQFRSKKVDESGQALGYQADAGEGYWGQLYHEHGRGKLDPNKRAAEAVKPGDWNHYEILAVGPAVWLAINGTVGAAYLDLDPTAERTGALALQIHSGPPQTVQYRITKLVRNPNMKLAGLDAFKLLTRLKIGGRQ